MEIIILAIIMSIILYILFKFKTNKSNEIKGRETNLCNNNENIFPNIQVVENNTLIPLEKTKL